MPKISVLPAATLPLTGPELVPLVQGGVTVQATVADLPGGGGGGYPHYVTPVGGVLSWAPTTGPAGRVELGDAGKLVLQGQPTSVFSWTNGATVDANLLYAAGSLTLGVGAGAIYSITTVAGGNIIVNDATNTLTEQAFTVTTRCWSAPNAGYWGGPGVPVDLERAVDRIAAVVSAGGGTPIP
jgi:hypothetical protein